MTNYMVTTLYTTIICTRLTLDKNRTPIIILINIIMNMGDILKITLFSLNIVH